MIHQSNTPYNHVWVNDWANYYGVDLGGWVCEFEDRPNRSIELWYTEEGKSEIVGFIDLNHEDDWKYMYGEREIPCITNGTKRV